LAENSVREIRIVTEARAETTKLPERPDAAAELDCSPAEIHHWPVDKPSPAVLRFETPAAAGPIAAAEQIAVAEPIAAAQPIAVERLAEPSASSAFPETDLNLQTGQPDELGLGTGVLRTFRAVAAEIQGRTAWVAGS